MSLRLRHALTKYNPVRLVVVRLGCVISLLWGILVFILAVRAPFWLNCNQLEIRNTCTLKVWPWTGHQNQCHCFAYGLFCRANPLLAPLEAPEMYQLLDILTKHNTNTPQSLRIIDCPVRHLPADVAGFSRLNILRIKRAPLEDVSEFDFGRMESIMVLQFEECQLRQLPIHLPSSCTFLLVFSAPQIEHLSPLVAHTWRHLVWVGLRGTRIRGFPMALLHFPHLIHISLTGSIHTGTIPANLTRLSQLQELELANTGLTQLPSQLRALTRLKRITLSGNNIARLEDLPWSREELEVWNQDAQNKTLLTLADNPICATALQGSRACLTQCAPQCDRSFLHDFNCQLECNHTACGYDHGFCLDPTNGALYN